MPDQIPIHYDGAGRPDAYGSKYILMILPLLATCTYFLFSYLNQRPYTFNYMVRITEENAERQYSLAMDMMSALMTVIILTFFFISWRTVEIAQGKASGLGWWFLPVFLMLTFLPIVFYLVKSGRKS